ncbi:hypothetical protein BpHYR1_016342 [Brachionus plicatilis]|uniref:Uncharacterized protein n=1 Tax=Brachionus plicatilis TaxID=10195 RepID=A0A3M7QYL5_BRAPC|nr:hypothetical protein BpHYR1_016342 [Brachionus plicatilis]
MQLVYQPFNRIKIKYLGIFNDKFNSIYSTKSRNDHNDKIKRTIEKLSILRIILSQFSEIYFLIDRKCVKKEKKVLLSLENSKKGFFKRSKGYSSDILSKYCLTI